jgi:MoaA/NifB/PqqE/SkfB family radical SAM enzyme
MSDRPERALELNLGKACQNRCVFCSNGAASRAERTWMPAAAALAELRAARDRGLVAVGFIGGEPTRHPALGALIAGARDLGFTRIALCTNGGKLGAPGKLDALLNAGLTRVTLSIHSRTARTEDALTGRAGAFQEKLEALRALTAAARAGRLPDGLSTNTVIHRRNVDDLPGLARFLADLGVNDLRLNFIRPENDALGSPDWVPTFTATAPGILALVALNETTLRRRIALGDLPLCQLPWELLARPDLVRRYLGEHRDLDTDVTLYRPEAAGGPERFNWRDQRTGQLKTYVKACGRCRLRDRCEGVWKGYLEIHGGGELERGPALAAAVAGSFGG